LDVGSEIAGYRVTGVLGRGGMGFVYEAEHLLLGRKAAIKTLVPELVEDGDFRERFINESQVVAALDHPNVIPIYDAGDADGIVYIAMRCVTGSDLAELLERDEMLPPTRALAILEQVGGALDAAHARDLVHRDVKPANVLIEGDGERVYLTDFGIAKQARSKGLTRTGFFVGTLDYAAPEQIQGLSVGPPADVYAFACLAFECLTGRKPFDRETDVAVMHAHLLDPPPSAAAVRPELPAEVDDVFAHALAKSEDERAASCREVVEMLRAALGEGTGTGVEGAAVPSTRRRRVLEHNLPVQATPIVGRDAEVAAVTELLRRDDVRLVTLTGLGGTGKTRLSVAVAEELLEALGRAWFVDLAPVREPDRVGSAIAQTLGVEEGGGRSVTDAVAARIGADPALLVLDNFEQVLPAAGLVGELLARIPSLKVLVTTQQPLHLREEREYPVPPLALPPAGDDDRDALAASAAVALFVDRAVAVRPDFELSDENAPAVAAICRQLDGLPLAIELAAARVKLLSPQAIVSRLESRLDLLTGGARDLPERQQTLRAAIDWSYNLLEPREQATLARLGVFLGGCALESAEAVCGAPEGMGFGEVLDSIASLVDKSLVRQNDGLDGEPRFTLLETIREYALGRLKERGELESLRRLHAERYLAVAEAAEPELVRASQRVWLERLDEENANLRAALAWSMEVGEIETGLRIAGALVRFWSTRGLMAEGRTWLVDALARADRVPEGVRAKAEFAAGYAALGVGDFAGAKENFERSLTLARSTGDKGAEAAALAQIGWLVMAAGSHERAHALVAKSLELSTELGDKLTASGATSTLAEMASATGDYEQAVALLEQGLGLRRELGDKRLIANSLLSLGRTELARGDTERALYRLTEGLALAREVKDTWSIGVAASTLASVRLTENDPEAAASLFGEGLAIARDRGDRRLASECLQGTAFVASARGDNERAARLLGSADALLESIGAKRTPIERAIRDRFEPVVRGGLGEDRYRTATREGSDLSLEDVLPMAIGDETAAAQPPPPLARSTVLAPTPDRTS
jgi:non-specific serine/threonine protein kinase